MDENIKNKIDVDDQVIEIEYINCENINICDFITNEKNLKKE